jgi:hypothetical protein
MKLTTKKVYTEQCMNRYKPTTLPNVKEMQNHFQANEQPEEDAWPNPLHRYRTPTPRLVPRGY